MTFELQTASLRRFIVIFISLNLPSLSPRRQQHRPDSLLWKWKIKRQPIGKASRKGAGVQSAKENETQARGLIWFSGLQEFHD